MGKLLFPFYGEVHTAPRNGIPLGEIAEGSIVYLNENGLPVPFYVAQHDYQSGQSSMPNNNRTLLVRKDIYSKKAWSTLGSNAWMGNTDCIGYWLDNTYRELLDMEVATAAKGTKFQISTGEETWSTGTHWGGGIFLLSLTELGLSATYSQTEGVKLNTASILLQVYYNDTLTAQWTRSMNVSGTTKVYYINTSRKAATAEVTTSYGIRPALALPETVIFDDNTLQFKEVA